jgi:transcription termination factor Rho
MSFPPKTDDDTSSAARAESSGEAKKTRRPRAAAKPRKPRTEKVRKSDKGHQSELPIVETRPEAPPRREEPSHQESRPPEPSSRPEPRESQSESRPESRPEPVAREESRPSPAPEPRPERPAQPAPASDGAAERPAPPPSASAPQPQQHPQQQHGHGHGHHRENRGDFPPHQPGGGERGFWKHGKRKRGRHGGQWQPGGGGGGGGGREQFPPQLPPPSTAMVIGELPNPTRFADLAALDALANEVSSGGGEPLWLNQIYAKPLAELTSFARELGVKFEGVPNRRQLLTEIFKFVGETKRPLRDLGYIDLNDCGAFVVHQHVNYRLFPEDAYLPESLIKRYGLKRGHRLEVTLQVPGEGERCPSVVRIDTVMGHAPDDISKVTPFEELVPYYPLKRILLEEPTVHPKDMSMRAVDILTPIGFGQRGLIVAPPRTGKTILLQNIANSISANSPDVKLILLLIDERPEEVTDFKRHTKGEVVSSTFDETPESHVHCAEMVIEIARRQIEQGEHVVILLDSITRLARAYNALAGNQGKTMSGGLESNALQKPKRFFGSARNIEGGGSLTIIASALVDTGSRMDEIIFEEFKGTGNSELHLDRGLVERRIFPAINIDRSGTRKEELIYHPDELQRIYALRRAMQGLGPIESMEMLITRLKKTKSNAEFLLSLAPK